MSDLESKIEAALERALVHPCADDFSALHALLPDALAELRRLRAENNEYKLALGLAAERVDYIEARYRETVTALQEIGSIADLLDSEGKAHDFRVKNIRNQARRVLDSEEQTP